MSKEKKTAVEIRSWWSAKHRKNIHRVGMQGTAHSFLANDDDLADLIAVAQGVLNGRNINRL